MATCKYCGTNINFISSYSGGYCVDCHDLYQKAKVQGKTLKQYNAEIIEETRHQQEIETIAEGMLVTTEMFCPDLKILERKGIVTAEVVVGMNVFKDLFAGVRNIVGGRSGVIQDALRDIREQVIDELKMEAARVGGNAVIAVDLDYQEIAASGSMLMLVASGTAVVIEQAPN